MMNVFSPLTLERPKQTDLNEFCGQPDLHSEFQTARATYIMRSCLQKRERGGILCMLGAGGKGVYAYVNACSCVLARSVMLGRVCVCRSE